MDPAYDATVIYHEYTHAALGADRLWGTPRDLYGLNPTPHALNEGLADYLPCSFVDNMKMGTYALGSLGAARDLTRVFKCPDHIVGEPHQDGEVASTVLWAMREIVGAEVAAVPPANFRNWRLDGCVRGIPGLGVLISCSWGTGGGWRRSFCNRMAMR